MASIERLTQGEFFDGENLLPPGKERELKIREIARLLSKGRNPGPNIMRLAEKVLDSGYLEFELEDDVNNTRKATESTSQA